jgi:molybdopterin converting factor small subunit
MEAIEVNVKLFGMLRNYLREYNPSKGAIIVLDKGNTIRDLVDVLNLPEGEMKLFFVKGLSRKITYQLEDTDEVSIFLPLGGG